MKHKVVIPLKHNFKVITTTDITPYKSMYPVYIDPDLTAVQYLSPDKWDYKNGKFLPKIEEKLKKSEEYHNIDKKTIPIVYNKYLLIYSFVITCITIGLIINKLI